MRSGLGLSPVYISPLAGKDTAGGIRSWSWSAGGRCVRAVKGRRAERTLYSPLILSLRRKMETQRMLDIVIRSYRPWSSRRSLYLQGVPAQAGSVSTDRAVVSVQTGGLARGVGSGLRPCLPV
jgi:hypothetical protein